MKFVVLVPVGPNEGEVERARDLLAALSHFEKDRFALVLVEDRSPPRPLTMLIAPELADRTYRVVNPRRNKGGGLGAGLAAGVLAGLHDAVELPGWEFVLKLDTDSLVIAPFADEIGRIFTDNPEVGIVGAYQFSPAQKVDRTSTPALEKLLRQITIWRRTPASGPALQLAFWGKYKRIRNILRRALLNGYRLGEHCSGGGYAVSRKCVEAFRQNGLLAEPTLWLQVPLSEDGISALCAAASGFSLRDDSDRLFGVQHRGLPAQKEVLMAQHRAIIHSIKDHGEQREAEIRDYFRRLRSQTEQVLVS